MTVGFKTGPKNWDEGQRLIQEDGAKMCEVWFRIDKAGDYSDMLSYLQKEHVAIGLHHWGLIDGTYKTNVASSNEKIRQATIQQIKDTIDVGSTLKNCAYVNAHSGARATETISFHPMRQALLNEDWADEEKAEQLFLASCQELLAYAAKKGILLTIETLPGKEPIDKRLNAYNAGNTPLKALATYASKGGYIANDITHSAGQIALETNDPVQMWLKLLTFTKGVALATKLLHINTVIPPFDGTDSHNGLLEEDFGAGAFPALTQIKTLLTIFAKRHDVFVIPEPREKMQENYRVLTQLLADIV